MRVQRHLSAFCILLLGANHATADGIAIDHKEVGCVIAGRFPQLFARFDPADAVAKAQVAFRSQGSSLWYSVPMKKDGHNFVGVLPRPDKSLKAFDYYIRVVDRSFNESRTSESSTEVVSGPAGCQGDKVLATALLKAKSILVNPPAGIANSAKVPLGFSDNGVVAGATSTTGSSSAAAGSGTGASGAPAGAGAATGAGTGAAGSGAGAGAAAAGTAAAAGGHTGVILAVVGAAAAGGVVAAKVIGGGTKYSGQFSGNLAMVFSGGCTRTEIHSGTLEINIKDGSSTLDGTASIDGNVQIGQPNPCGPPDYKTSTFGIDHLKLAGTTDAMTFSGGTSNNFTDAVYGSGTNTYEYTFAGSKNGAEITGTLTVTRTITNDKGTAPGVGQIICSVTLR